MGDRARERHRASDRQKRQERQAEKEGVIHADRGMLVFFSQGKLMLFVCFTFFCFILQPYL